MPVRRRERGMVLVSSLLLLVVVTLLAVSMFRSFGLDEKIASNVREKQIALHAAESAQQYAEWWLSAGNGTSAVACSGVVLYTVGQVCTSALSSVVTGGDVSQVPWNISGTNVGVTYNPANLTALQFSQPPVFYIAFLGSTTQAKIYQIDAVGYGDTLGTAAVVESTYMVQSSVKDLSGP
jgi:type IV pilus assembly protein PilX